MAYWVGLGFIAISGLLLASAFARRARARRAYPAAGHAPSNDNTAGGHTSMQILRDVAPSLVIVALAYMGVKGTLLFLMLDGSQVLSYFDLVGFLALLVSYGLWLKWRVRYTEAEETPSRPMAGPAPRIAAGVNTRGSGIDGRTEPVSDRNAADFRRGRRAGRV